MENKPEEVETHFQELAAWQKFVVLWMWELGQLTFFMQMMMRQ